MEPGQSSADSSWRNKDNVNEDPEWVTVEYEYINGCGRHSFINDYCDS